MTKELIQEYTLKITQANKSQMVVIIYEMLEEYIGEARINLSNRNEALFHDSIRKCTGCIRELIASVNENSAIAGNLLSLYVFCIKELAKADVHYSAEELDNVERIINKLHKAFGEVAIKDDSAPVMGNTQRVYAGLTYGKESLIVNLNSEGNRGFTV